MTRCILPRGPLPPLAIMGDVSLCRHKRLEWSRCYFPIESLCSPITLAHLRLCALLVPKEMKLEHSGGVKDLTDEELEQAIAAIKAMLAAQAGEAAKVIEGEAEVVPSLPAPSTRTPAS